MNLTVIFIFSIVVVCALFDVWIIWKKGKRESISAHVIRGSKNFPLLVLAFGILLGHLFWNMDDRDIYENYCENIEKNVIPKIDK